MMTGHSGPPLDPLAAIRPGTFDAAALLIFCLLRSAVPAIFIAGLIYAWLASERGFEAVPDVTSAGQAFWVLLSPFVGVAAAVLLRIAVGFVALALAYPLSRRVIGSTVGPDLFRRPFRVWIDRLLAQCVPSAPVDLRRAASSGRPAGSVRHRPGLGRTRAGRHRGAAAPGTGRDDRAESDQPGLTASDDVSLTPSTSPRSARAARSASLTTAPPPRSAAAAATCSAIPISHLLTWSV